MSKISFVIPVYNSEKTISKVVLQLIDAYLKSKYKFEIILVNDCSKDQSDKICRAIVYKYKFVRYISLSKNYGQHNAILTGLRYVNGDYAICLDDDMQTPPEESKKLIDKLESSNYDVVFGNYANKKHNLLRNIGTKINDIMARMLLEKPKDISITSFFILRRFIIDELLKYYGPNVYLPGLIMQISLNIGSTIVEHKKRVIGRSNYSITKLLGLWLIGVTNFSIKPLRLCTLLGFLFSFLGFLMSFYILLRKILSPNIPIGWTSVILVVIVLGGLNLLFIGLVGEYVGKIILSVNKQPQSIIRDTLNVPNHK